MASQRAPSHATATEPCRLCGLLPRVSHVVAALRAFCHRAAPHDCRFSFVLSPDTASPLIGACGGRSAQSLLFYYTASLLATLLLVSA